MQKKTVSKATPEGLDPYGPASKGSGVKATANRSMAPSPSTVQRSTTQALIRRPVENYLDRSWNKHMGNVARFSN